MSNTSRRPENRAVRPSAESLERRELLAKVLSGVDIDGDRWVLRLTGPGDLRVVNQPDSAGDPIPLGTAALIDEIAIGGTDPTISRLTGRVTKAATGDGKVFFEDFHEFNGLALKVIGFNGIHVIDMPDFWLGRTSTTATVAGTPAANLEIPDGVNTLRFGGVDTTYTPPGGTALNTNGRDDTILVNLGLPRSGGTSILIDRSISSAQAATSATAQPTQDGVQFSVIGRINVFQANEIVGNKAIPSGQFIGDGGTLVISSSGTEPGAIDAGELTGQVTGQIGYLRVNGDATNFSVQTNDRITNFYIGAETNNVFLLAPGGSRYLGFGRGMDTTTIDTQTIAVLQANRGALDSSVTAKGIIGQVILGGDVVNTTIRSGYNVDLAQSFQFQSSPDPDAPAIAGGHIRDILIAGDVVNSVFAASVQPYMGQIGTTNDLLLSLGTIYAKVEGTINNADAVPDSPDQAFFAQNLQVIFGPVTPPRVPEPPKLTTSGIPHGPRLPKLLLPNDPAAPSRRARLPRSTR